MLSCMVKSILAASLLILVQLGEVMAQDSRTKGGLNSDWLTASPEDVGLDSAALAEMFEYVSQRKVPVHSVQIVRHGRLALDAYFYPFSAEMRHDVASVTKSITSTLVGLAIQKGYLRDVRQPVPELFSKRSISNLDERKKKITLADLLTMQAGWDCGFEPKEARLFEMRRSTDWLQFMLDLPMVAEPGTRFAYCSGNPHVLSIIVSQAAGTNALAFARQELFGPLGIQDVRWPTDPNGYNHGWGDLQLHPRDMAKIGQLILQRGRWGERQLLSEAWIADATRQHVDKTVNKDHYGYAWWVKGEDFPGMFEAVGRGGQRITVWPDKDMVVVFTGGEFEPGDLAKFILKALRPERTLPPNSDASNKLCMALIAAARPPTAHSVPKAPRTAALVSGKLIKIQKNTSELEEITLRFSDSAEGIVELLWLGHREHFTIGLDGVDRFSPNTIVDLPTACRGEWIGETTFVLRINLVGGINYYEVRLNFAGQQGKVDIRLKERTGLNDERFEGLLSEAARVR